MAFLSSRAVWGYAAFTQQSLDLIGFEDRAGTDGCGHGRRRAARRIAHNGVTRQKRFHVAWVDRLEGRGRNLSGKGYVKFSGGVVAKSSVPATFRKSSSKRSLSLVSTANSRTMYSQLIHTAYNRFNGKERRHHRSGNSRLTASA